MWLLHPGMMMRAQALLQTQSCAIGRGDPQALEPKPCRCGTHMRILAAVRRAARHTNSAATEATEVSR